MISTRTWTDRLHEIAFWVRPLGACGRITIRIMGTGMARRFTIDMQRLGRYRAAADAARGASRAAQQRTNDLRADLREAEAELARIERSRPGEPSLGAIRVEGGRRQGRLESRHADIVGSARRRVESVAERLRQASRESDEGAAARDHAVQLYARLEAHARDDR